MGPRYDNRIATLSRSNTAQKAVIEFLRMIARRAVIEDISGHQQHINVLGFNKIGQPVQKRFIFIVSLAPMQTRPILQSEVWRSFILLFFR